MTHLVAIHALTAESEQQDECAPAAISAMYPRRQGAGGPTSEYRPRAEAPASHELQGLQSGSALSAPLPMQSQAESNQSLHVRSNSAALRPGQRVSPVPLHRIGSKRSFVRAPWAPSGRTSSRALAISASPPRRSFSAASTRRGSQHSASEGLRSLAPQNASLSHGQRGSQCCRSPSHNESRSGGARALSAPLSPPTRLPKPPPLHRIGVNSSKVRRAWSPSGQSSGLAAASTAASKAVQSKQHQHVHNGHRATATKSAPPSPPAARRAGSDAARSHPRGTSMPLTACADSAQRIDETRRNWIMQRVSMRRPRQEPWRNARSIAAPSPPRGRERARNPKAHAHNANSSSTGVSSAAGPSAAMSTSSIPSPRPRRRSPEAYAAAPRAASTTASQVCVIMLSQTQVRIANTSASALTHRCCCFVARHLRF